MPSNVWHISNRATGGSAATATQAATGTSGNAQLRCRAIQATLVGTSAATDRLVVRDGASGVGTIIFSADLSVAANGMAALPPTPVDLRASPGNALTVEFVNGAGTAEDVNAQGDIIPQGWPYNAD